MFKMFIGFGMVLAALLPKGKFYPGRFGTTQPLPSLEPAWIGRLFVGGLGLAVILDGIRRIHHH
jgi:hypothetical protein